MDDILQKLFADLRTELWNRSLSSPEPLARNGYSCVYNDLCDLQESLTSFLNRLK